MAEFEKGQIFLDLTATDFKHPEGKPKYFLAMNDVDDDGEMLICFALNTEPRMDLFHVGCNDKKRYVLMEGAHPVIVRPTSLFMDKAACFYFSEFYEDNIKLFDGKVAECKMREIKNCIDFDSTPVKFVKIIKEAFKIKK